MDVGLPSIAPRTIAAVNRAMQVAIGVVLLVGLGTGNASVVINATVALLVTALPAVLERDYRIPLAPSLTFWLSAAVLLHAVGMLGPYRALWWWDHVTHTLSAGVVASVGYATARALDVHSDAVYFTPRFMTVFVLLFTVALGVAWEVVEFGARAVGEAFGYGPILVQYGFEDTIVDLVFDAVGALAVALFGTDGLSDVVDALVRRLGSAGG